MPVTKTTARKCSDGFRKRAPEAMSKTSPRSATALVICCKVDISPRCTKRNFSAEGFLCSDTLRGRAPTLHKWTPERSPQSAELAELGASAFPLLESKMSLSVGHPNSMWCSKNSLLETGAAELPPPQRALKGATACSPKSAFDSLQSWHAST